MSNSREFQVMDALTAPLQGVNLVEANAGTGKTYNIVSIYLRLLLQKSITVDRILVVSFTEAATAELRDRIRQRLRRLQTVFETGAGDKNDLAFLALCNDRETGLRCIVRALQSFDEAAIYTIHAFCQRLLSDAAFEAGLSLRTELITDDDELRQQLVHDFWHAETKDGSHAWVGYLLQNADPARLHKDLAKYFSRPLVRRLIPSEPGSSVELEQEFATANRQAQQCWLKHSEQVRELLLGWGGLNRRSYSPARINTLVALAQQWSVADNSLFGFLNEIDSLGSTALLKGTKKNCDPPTHEFFVLLQQTLDLQQQLQLDFAQRLAVTRDRLLEFAAAELPRRKQQRRVRHFDDLLRDVYMVLQSKQQDALRLAARTQYSAALIDEFQDTDPLQFAIFDQLFCGDDMPVFFVGDPKQAIYAFRGADVYAYLDARAHATGRYRLETNYRSTPNLVNGINAVFQGATNPFVLPGIDFSCSSAAQDKTGLQIDGVEQPALRWWQVASEAGKAISKGQAERQIAEAVATDITELLQKVRQGRATKPGDAALEAKDIAVLVNSHKQGRMVRDALSRRGVVCMQRSWDNVFRTPEAEELLQVLRAVLEPSQHQLVRAALATQMLGYDAHEIDALADDDNAWQELLDRFAEYPELWREHGYSRMFRRILRDFSVESRLLALVHGQRRVTNHAHLADLLQRETERCYGRLDKVLIWMRQQQKIEHPSDQTMLLRLESDENLVNIMTVHFSKGLQFPVVYCPFLWTTPQQRKNDVVEFHDNDNRLVLDLGSEDLPQNQVQARVEDLAESVRLAYVALTRAELSCTAVWGALNSSKNSGLNWLLHASAPGPVVPAQLSVPGSDAEIRQWLETLAGDAVTVETMPPASTGRLLTSTVATASMGPRKLQRVVSRGAQVASFSALTRHAIEEPRDYDAGKSTDRPAISEPQGIFAFPRGARAGRCMHALLENIDFDAATADITPVACEVLAEHGYDPQLAGVLSGMAVNVLATGLDDGGLIRLRDVSAEQRLSEMEFYFPTAGLGARSLRQTLGEFGNGTPIAQRLESLDFKIGSGFMHGFIDLVFESQGRYYLVDYKSNWLGNERDDYRGDLLDREIARHDYYLQYLIYGLALHRHLTLRLPDYDYDRHFGGVYYLFLRGMHPDSGNQSGVFADRPDRELMRSLEQLFCPTDPVR
ncbi:MAG: exodeoxyribonuclease V subunit beta [Gammaproteobacteria bacterium]|nr:exodeoxyribonuclease V subunit beta [Gammaproteobacteria bacterium]